MRRLIMPIQSKNSWPIVVIAASFLAAVLVLMVISEEAALSQHDITTTSMYIIRCRIFAYIKDHGVLPTSLRQLSARDGRGNVNQDGWGSDIIYLVDSNGVVTLKSSGGHPNVEKGIKNGEIVESFPTTDSNGNWRTGAGADF
jgi:hypothetical protein